MNQLTDLFGDYVIQIYHHSIYFFSLGLQPQFGPWPTSMKLSVSLRFSRS
jgi:hypothetical protein